jgi:WD40 repeat protein
VNRRWSAELQTLEGHSDYVNSVAFSLDGRLLASGSDHHTIRLWDPITGTLQRTLRGHSDSISSVVFSPNGRLLASGSDDRTLRLWDPATGLLQQIFEGYKNSVLSLAFSPNGKLLESGSGTRHDWLNMNNEENTFIWIWDLATGMRQQALEGNIYGVSLLTFSPNSRLLASSSEL